MGVWHISVTVAVIVLLVGTLAWYVAKRGAWAFGVGRLGQRVLAAVLVSGIAAALLARCLARLAARGIPKCNALLFDDNAAGREFWRHAGWSERADLSILQKLVR